MNTLKNIKNRINNYLESKALNYIDNVSKTLYPKPHLEEEDDDKHDPYPMIHK